MRNRRRDWAVRYHPNRQESDFLRFIWELRNRPTPRANRTADDLIAELDLLLQLSELEREKVVALVNGEVEVQLVRAHGGTAACLLAVYDENAVIFGGIVNGTWRDCVAFANSYKESFADAFDLEFSSILTFENRGDYIRHKRRSPNDL